MGDAGQTWRPPRTPQAFPLGKGNIYPTDEGHVSDHEHNVKNDDNVLMSIGSQCLSTNLGLCHWTIPKRGLGVGHVGMELSSVYTTNKHTTETEC